MTGATGDLLLQSVSPKTTWFSGVYKVPKGTRSFLHVFAELYGDLQYSEEILYNNPCHDRLLCGFWVPSNRCKQM